MERDRGRATIISEKFYFDTSKNKYRPKAELNFKILWYESNSFLRYRGTLFKKILNSSAFFHIFIILYAIIILWLCIYIYVLCIYILHTVVHLFPKWPKFVYIFWHDFLFLCFLKVIFSFKELAFYNCFLTLNCVRPVYFINKLFV